MLAYFDVGAVEGADGERAVERELHVAGPRRLHACGRDLFGKISGGNHRFGDAHVVIGQEDDLEQVANGRVSVDDGRDVVDELDDELRPVIAGRSLTGEDLHTRHPAVRRAVAHRVI